MVCFTRNEPEVREYLRRREGEGFVFPVLPVRLRDGNDVHAWVGIYAGKNVMPVSPGGEKATMVKDASGKDGSCSDYVREIASILSALGIEDAVVSELWAAMKQT